MCTRERAGHAVCMGSPLGALANLADTIVIKDGNVFLVSAAATAACRPTSSTRSASGSGTAASCARTSCASAAACRGCSRPPTPPAPRRCTSSRIRTSSSRDGGRVPAESLRLRVERDGRGRGRAAPADRGAELPPRSRSGCRSSCASARTSCRCSSCAASCRSTSGRRPTPAPTASRSSGATECAAATRIRATPEPRVLDDGSLVFDLDLEARGAIDLVVDFEVSESGDGEVWTGAPRKRHEDGTTVTSDDQLFNRILTRSLDDLDLLRSELDGHSYYAAGVPWFATLFGRDSLITSFQTLSFVRGIAGGHAAAARRPARAGVQRRARRGARQGPPRAARGRAGGARRDAVRALLRLGRRHAAVPLPARPPRRLVRQPRPVPRAARAR